ncbi:Hypothetical predicted protein [Cloeon dipterum]|uniref:Uncharacterized protein n=1 Tax=Cloeon dipterum TaxID=197152 RepID=A0A8S1DVM7_9INSE|nr:Hypothetical predicted protein [Cloeon dipterum]
MKQAILDCMTLKVKPTEAEVDKYMTATTGGHRQGGHHRQPRARRPPPAATGKAATTGGHGHSGHHRRPRAGRPPPVAMGKAATTGGHGQGGHHRRPRAGRPPPVAICLYDIWVVCVPLLLHKIVVGIVIVTQEKEEIESKLKNDQKFRKAVVISLSGNSAIPNGVGTILKRRL